MPRNKRRSQIATILTLVMAVIFLFIAITINIGNIAQEKTMVSNASDGAALMLASMLGSLANALRVKLELWGEEEEGNCNLDLALIGAIFALIASIILTIATLGAASPSVFAVVAALIGLAGSAALFGVGMWNAIVSEPGVFKQIELKFQNMTMEQRMKEKALQYAIFAVVSDPNKVCKSGKAGGGDPKDPDCGGCSDPEDLDMDNQTTDCILWFSKWYNDRLKALPRTGEVVTYFYEKTFSNKLAGRAPRFYVWENSETWKPIKDGFGFWEYSFWIDTNSNSRPDPLQGSLKLEVSSDNPKDPQGVVYAHDIYFSQWNDKQKKHYGWLEQRFKPLVKKLHDNGYGLSADLKATTDNIGSLEGQIKDFNKEISEIYGATFETRLESFDEWIKIFYNGDPGKQDWYKRMGNWLNIVNNWISELTDRRDAIIQCASSCEAKGPYRCGATAGGEVCDQTYVPKTCTRHIDQTCTDPITGESSDCGYDEEYDCSYCNPAVGWCNCENGSTIDGGRLCPSGHCRPTAGCTTPFGVSKQCCEIADNGLYYQLCDATPASSGGNDSQCGATSCTDTYYQCNFNPDNNVITREHAIEYLAQFADDVQVLRDVFKKTYEDGLDREKDPRFYEALYEWDDKVAKGGVGEQKVHHIAYVKLSDDLKPENGFKVPYIHNYREWLPPKSCSSVEAAKGTFTITVGRYDQDVAGAAESAPLKNLWIFKTRQKPSDTEAVQEGHTLKEMQSGYTAPDAYPSSYATKAKFVLDNGVVGETEGNYGPGYTYKKDVVEAWGAEAAKRNKDIFIKRKR